MQPPSPCLPTATAPAAVAVVLPVYQPEIDRYGALALASLRRHLPEVPRILIRPAGVSLRYDVADFTIQDWPPAHFTSIAAYSRLLMAPEFYRAFQEYDYILIYQLDCLLCRGDLTNWCQRGYSYIGAPWLARDWRRRKRRPVAVGNGGLSLRRVRDCLAVLSAEKFRLWPVGTQGRRHFLTKPRAWHRLWQWRCRAHTLAAAENCPIGAAAGRVFDRGEDEFWSYLAPQLDPEFHFPEPAEALDFAFESQPRALWRHNHQRLPFGTHAWFKMDEAFWRERLGL